MEKVTVRISRAGPQSLNRSKFDRAEYEDRDFLRRAFGISYNRANALLKKLTKQSGCNQDILLDLTFEQLGRYTAMRRVEGLQEYWRYPHCIELVWDMEDAPQDKPIELRPGKRSIP